MSEKKFEVLKAETESGGGYRGRILGIINDVEVKVRAVTERSDLDDIHRKAEIDPSEDIERYKEIRTDVCETFGVPEDENHVFHAVLKGKMQRVVEAFYIMIDTAKKEAFYADGRCEHMHLLNTIIDSTGRKSKEVFAGIDGNPPAYLVFKGFLTLSRSELGNSRKVFETPLVDHEGNIIETPQTWFVTGHNVPNEEGEKTI